MKKFAVIVLLSLATTPVFSSVSSGSGDSDVVVASTEPRTVAVALTLPAEFVSVPVSIVSEEKSASLAYKETQQALETIAQKARENGHFRILTGVIALSQHKGGSGILSGSWSQPAGSAVVYLLAPLTKETNNIFAAGAGAAAFVEGLHLPGKVRCDLGQLQPAIGNPEQYRVKLLGMVAQEIKAAREALSAAGGGFEVRGLENPVMVRQSGDRNVELFINYTLSVTAQK